MDLFVDYILECFKFQIIATDRDIDENAVLHYTISSVKRKSINLFSIHPQTGVVYSDHSFHAGEEYLIQVKILIGT